MSWQLKNIGLTGETEFLRRAYISSIIVYPEGVENGYYPFGVDDRIQCYPRVDR
jgi:hypothetical protein